MQIQLKVLIWSSQWEYFLDGYYVGIIVLVLVSVQLELALLQYNSD